MNLKNDMLVRVDQQQRGARSAIVQAQFTTPETIERARRKPNVIITIVAKIIVVDRAISGDSTISRPTEQQRTTRWRLNPIAILVERAKSQSFFEIETTTFFLQFSKQLCYAVGSCENIYLYNFFSLFSFYIFRFCVSSTEARVIPTTAELSLVNG